MKLIQICHLSHTGLYVLSWGFVRFVMTFVSYQALHFHNFSSSDGMKGHVLVCNSIFPMNGQRVCCLIFTWFDRLIHAVLISACLKALSFNQDGFPHPSWKHQENNMPYFQPQNGHCYLPITCIRCEHKQLVIVMFIYRYYQWSSSGITTISQNYMYLINPKQLQLKSLTSITCRVPQFQFVQ